MIVTPLQIDYPSLLRSQADEQGLPRSPGLHLTPIIRDIEETIKPRDQWCSQQELEFFGAMGFMWERLFSTAFAESIASGELYRPGEIELDGITGSPDLFRVTDDGLTVVETKACWKSVKKFGENGEGLEREFWYWQTQTASYCHMIGANIAEIHAYFVCGDWRPPIPQTRSVRIEFTSQELKNNWNMIVRHAIERNWL